MRDRKPMRDPRSFVGLLPLLALAFTCTDTQSNGLWSDLAPKKEPVSVSAKAEPNRCSFYASVPYWDQERALRSFRSNAGTISYVSLFWYHLTPDGGIAPYKRARANHSTVVDAQNRGATVLAIITNLPDDEREGDGLTWDPKRVGKILRSRRRRRAHIRDLLNLTYRMDFDGIHIDYEALPKRQRRRFTQFISELGTELRAAGKILAVAVHPKTSEENPREDNGSWAQDWQALLPHVDQLHLMTYSQHTAQTRPGPVASVEWVEPILQYAVRELQLSKAKLFVGIPLYAEEWRWEEGEFSGKELELTHRDVESRIAAHDAEQFWSEKHASPHLSYRDDSEREHHVWYEDKRSVHRKLQLAADKYGLCQFALWRVGGEDPDLWPMLRAFLAGDQRVRRK